MILFVVLTEDGIITMIEGITHHDHVLGILIQTPVKPQYAKRHCGYAGCAVGEMPAVWPKKFTWQLNNGVVSIEDSGDILFFPSNVELAGDFFNLSAQGTSHLFLPTCQHYGRQVGVSATADRVGKHILKFVEDVESGRAETHLLVR